MRIIVINDIFDKNNRYDIERAHDGLSVAGIASDLGLNGDLVYSVSGKVVEADYIPADSDELIITPRVGDGASSWFSIVVGVGLIVAGIWLGPGFTAAGISMLAGAAVGMAAKHFIKSGTPDFSTSATYSWGGISNTYGEGSPMPVLYGRHRVGGNVVAGFVAGTTTSGLQDNKYLHMLLAVSEGDIWGVETDTIKIADTDIADYDDTAEYFTTTGAQNQVLPAFNSSFNTIRRRYLFTSARVAYGSPYIYTLQDTADAVLTTIYFPALFRTNSKGSIVKNTVNIIIQYSPVDVDAWGPELAFACAAAQKSTTEFDYLINFPSSGKWKIRITRVTTEFTSATASGDSYLKAVEENVDAQINYRNTALLGLVIKATDKISGSAPDVTAVVKGIKVLDVRTMTAREDTYRNPANHVYDLLTNKRYGLGNWFSDDNIDIDNLIDFADFCDELVTYSEYDSVTGSYITKTEKRFEYDLVLDQSYQAFDILQKICGSCRAIPMWSGNKFKIVIDREAEYVQVFSMGNIVADSFAQNYNSFTDIPTQIDVDYTDADNDFESTKLSVVDTSRLDEPTISKSIELYGLTTQSRVRRECLYTLRKLKSVRQTIEFAAEIGAVVSEVGDVIKVQHDVPAYGNGGRVELDGTKFLFESPLSVSAGQTYSLIVRRMDGTQYKHVWVAAMSESLDYVVLDDIDFADNDLYLVGVIDKEGKLYRITEITKGSDDYTVKITAAEYNESVYTEDDVSIEDVKYSNLGLTKLGTVAEDGTVAADNQQSVNPSTLIIPYVSNVTVEQSGMYALVNGAAMTNVTVTWDAIYIPAVGSGFISKYAVLLSDDGVTWTTAATTSAASAVVSGIVMDKTYYVAIKAYSSYNTQNYPETHQQYVTFSISQPDITDVAGITCVAGVYAINVSVAFEQSSSIAGVELLMCAVNDRDSGGTTMSTSDGVFNIGVNEIGGRRYFWARIKDIFGQYGLWYPEDGTAGIEGTTTADATLLLQYLKDSIGTDQLDAILSAKIDLTGDVNDAITGMLMYEPGMYEDGMYVKTSADVEGVDGRLTTQKTAINKLETVSGELQTQMADAQTSLQAVNDGLGNLSSDVSQKASTASVGDLTQRVTNSEQTISSQQTAIGNLSADVSNKASTASVGDLTQRVANSEQTISSQQTAIGNMQSQIESKASVDSVTALGEQYAAAEETITAIQDDTDGLKAQIVLKVDANGNVAAMGTYADETGTAIKMLANVFAFMMPDGSGDPVYVVVAGNVNGQRQVGLNGALIVDGSVTAKSVGTNELITDTANIKDGVIEDANLKNATITMAKIKDAIQSDNYVQGVSGWKLYKSGDLEANSGTFRGILTGNVLSANDFYIQSEANPNLWCLPYFDAYAATYGGVYGTYPIYRNTYVNIGTPDILYFRQAANTLRAKIRGSYCCHITVPTGGTTLTVAYQAYKSPTNTWVTIYSYAASIPYVNGGVTITLPIEYCHVTSDTDFTSIRYNVVLTASNGASITDISKNIYAHVDNIINM